MSKRLDLISKRYLIARREVWGQMREDCALNVTGDACLHKDNTSNGEGDTCCDACGQMILRMRVCSFEECPLLKGAPCPE